MFFLTKKQIKLNLHYSVTSNYVNSQLWFRAICRARLEMQSVNRMNFNQNSNEVNRNCHSLFKGFSSLLECYSEASFPPGCSSVGPSHFTSGVSIPINLTFRSFSGLTFTQKISPSTNLLTLYRPYRSSANLHQKKDQSDAVSPSVKQKISTNRGSIFFNLF